MQKNTVSKHRVGLICDVYSSYECSLENVAGFSLQWERETSRKSEDSWYMNMWILCVMQVADAGDWRKNVEDKADRKKMFEAA